MELESDSYDVVVIGTGLAESIAAAVLAKIGKSVLHLDPNEYYAAEQASLTLDELIIWAQQRSSTSSNDSPKTSDPAESTSSSSSGTSPYNQAQRSRYTHASTSQLTPELEKDRRRYALSLFPAVLPSSGALISTLIDSNVSKYVGFRLLDSVNVWENQEDPSDKDSDLERDRKVGGSGSGSGKLRRVPGTKEDVFKDKSVGLVDKRRLMQFLMFVGGDFESDEILKGKENQPLPEFLVETFSIPRPLAIQITYGIAHCSTEDEPTLPALLRTRRYLQSVGRYGSGAFLIGQYGGAGEVAQGFCRACAVKGGTYILGEQGRPTDISLDPSAEPQIKISLPSHPTPISTKHLITSPDHPPTSLKSSSTVSSGVKTITARGIAILPSLPSCLRKDASQRDDDSNAEEALVEQDDTAIILFPPKGESGLVRALLMGEGTGSCPAGQYIVYLSTSTSSTDVIDPKTLLKPYLDKLHPEPLFSAFYLSHSTRTSLQPDNLSESSQPGVVALNPYSGDNMFTEGLDWEAEQGQAAFWAVVGGKKQEVKEGEGFFEKEEKDDEEGLEGDEL